jgi:hypothetical protein
LMTSSTALVRVTRLCDMSRGVSRSGVPKP